MPTRAQPSAARGLDDPAVAAILAWWDAEARPLPWRASRDVYAIWVSEVMSAQTTVTRAAHAWTAWMERWPTVQALARASLAEVLAQWQGLGYPRRARDLHRGALIVAGSGWPADLRALPGVGAYIDAAVRCFAREEPVLPLDVNVRRVLARRLPGELDITADPWRAGQALMEFGQRVCTARPRCETCPVSAGCPGPGAASAGARLSRQKPFAGSLRQRRGRLLAHVLAQGSVSLADADGEAAAGLVADGLIRRDGALLRAPVEPGLRVG